MVYINKFIYKENEYTLGDIIKLRASSPLYQNGYVTDLQTGEVLDISKIDEWRELYICDLMSSVEKRKALKNLDYNDKYDKYTKKVQ